MNSQEVPLNRPKCNCCKECIQAVNRSNRSPQILQCPKSKVNHEFCEQYAATDNQNCHQQGNIDYEESCYPRSRNQNGLHQKMCIDHHTLHILNNLRQRARKLIETSDPSDSEEYKSGSCRTDAYSKERTRIPNIDYSPQSNYLKMMKQRSNDVSSLCKCSNSSSSPDNGQRIFQPKFCHCSSARKEIMPHRNSILKNQSQHQSDWSSVHDPCTCFKAWRLKNYEETKVKCPDKCPDTGVPPRSDYREVCEDQIFYKSDYDDAECEEKTQSTKKTEHVSRKNKRKKSRRRKRKSKIGECVESLEGKLDFKPSLKRPQPNSCERCWRYASPSRSPVNKPFQRFDPNYRRSHSLMNFDAANNGTSPATENEDECDAETSAHKVTDSEEPCIPKAKSAVDIKKIEKCQNTKKRPENEARKEKSDVQAKPAAGRGTASGKDSANKAATSVGDATSAACFCDKMKMREPIQCSPSMFDKEDKKPPKSLSRPSTATSSKSSRGKKSPKQRPFSSKAEAQSTNDCSFSQKLRSESSDRRQTLPSYNRGLHETKENLLNSEARATKAPRLTYRSLQTGNFEKTHKRCTGIGEAQEKAALWDDFTNDENCVERDDYSSPNGCRCPDVNVRSIYERTEHSPELHDADNKYWEKVSRNSDGCKCCRCRNSEPSNPPLIQCPSATNVSPRRRDSMNFWEKILQSNDCDDFLKHYENRQYERKGRKYGEKDLDQNPRKYCVFYMTKNKEKEDDDVEILIEELTEGKCGKGADPDAKAETVKSRMKKVAEHKLDSMALRFQKGITGKCKKYKNNRVLYF